MYVYFCFLFFWFVHFLLLSRLIQHSTCEKSKYERAVPFISTSYLGTALQLLNAFPFLSRLHASFPWISCHCVPGAYIEAIILIRYNRFAISTD